MSNYFLVLKTGSAELRAYANLGYLQKQYVTPIVELTRGRKNHPKAKLRTGEDYNFSSIKAFLEKDLAAPRAYFLDVTKEDSLSSTFTNSLRSSQGGYAKWVAFVKAQQIENPWAGPVLQVSAEPGQSWEEYQGALAAQFAALAQTSLAMGYRAMKNKDSEFDIDLQVLAPQIEKYTSEGREFFIILDYDYIRPGTGELHSLEASEIFSVINSICPTAQLVLISTSFPKVVTDVGGEEYGRFRLEEVYFHKITSQRLHNVAPVVYGDYGSINPIRNDSVARGWRPRIDYPFGGDEIFYYREKRDSNGEGEEKVYSSYASHYRSVASKVTADLDFLADPLTAGENWGVEQIVRASDNFVPSSSPSFWISVRMNIHIHQQVLRLSRP